MVFGLGLPEVAWEDEVPSKLVLHKTFRKVVDHRVTFCGLRPQAYATDEEILRTPRDMITACEDCGKVVDELLSSKGKEEAVTFAEVVE